MNELVGRASAWLAARGVRPGDRVAWQLPNGPLAASMFRATWRVGGVAVPLHHRATASEVDAILAPLDARVVVSTEDERSIGAATGEPPAPVALGDDDLALILHTAGSSGPPKAVLHRAGALTRKARTMVGVHGLGPSDCVLMPAPLGHISGILNGVLVPGAAGMRSVLMARWDPDEALRIVEAERVTFMVGPPAFFVALRDASGFTPSRVRSLRLISAGASGITPEFCEEFSGLLHAVVKRSYGSTEAPTMTTSHVGDPVERGWTTDGRAAGAGVGLRVAPNGELEVTGPDMFVGYLDPAQTSAAMTPDGWFRTGDLASIDDGWVTITGRLGDGIIRGGENVAPGEIEAALAAHPAVTSAVVVGATDERLGERIVAVVETSDAFGLDECRRWCDERGLARFKWPDEVRVVDEIPLLASGKPDRAALRGGVGST